ncbi:unnamed protein product [Schistosoma margrebowiei]|uniref:Uncharacterized protein n=1 Tax=Schistosoma margrebowiei TaxID=48269 RepID=A0A183LUS3_9TREM|nr:unnamed protein product [Schistosoma margrebowiei]
MCIYNSPVRKFTIISNMNNVSEILLKISQFPGRSSLKKEIITGNIIRLAISRMSIITFQ